MWPVNNKTEYEAALVAGSRVERWKAELYDRDFRPLGKPLTLANEGGIQAELRGEPQARASIGLLDPTNSLPPHNDARWYSWNIYIWVETWLRDLGIWEPCPLFFGPIQDVSQSLSGLSYEIDADTKDAQHLHPHTFAGFTAFREHTKLHVAIKEGLQERGETKFQLAHTRHRLHENRGGKIDVAPWKVFKAMAREAGMQLFYRNDGTVCLREWPGAPSWRFKVSPDGTMTEYPQGRTSVGPVRDTIYVIGRKTERKPVPKEAEMDQKSIIGATSIHVENKPAFLDVLEAGMPIDIGGQGANDPERRKIAGSYTPGSRTIPLSNALSRAHNVGAPVSVVVKKDVEKAVVGKAELGQNHPFSAQAQTGGKRPRIEVLRRASVHNVKRATELAEDHRDRIAGEFEQAISVSTVPIWPLELGDLFLVNDVDIDHRSRIQGIFYPCEQGAAMRLNWLGERPPHAKR